MEFVIPFEKDKYVHRKSAYDTKNALKVEERDGFIFETYSTFEAGHLDYKYKNVLK